MSYWIPFREKKKPEAVPGTEDQMPNPLTMFHLLEVVGSLPEKLLRPPAGSVGFYCGLLPGQTNSDLVRLTEPGVLHLPEKELDMSLTFKGLADDKFFLTETAGTEEMRENYTFVLSSVNLSVLGVRFPLKVYRVGVPTTLFDGPYKVKIKLL